MNTTSMNQTCKIATIAMFAALMLMVVPGTSFAQESRDVSNDRLDERDRLEREQREREQREREQRDAEREKQRQDRLERIEEIREKNRLEREAQRDAQRETLEREVISEFIERPHVRDPTCPDFDLQLVNPEVDGMKDNHMLKCYAKHLKAENDTLKNALVKIWSLMHRLAAAYGVQ